MKKFTALMSLVAAALVLSAPGAWAKDADKSKPGAMVVEGGTLSSTVESIDYKARTVTLKDEEGEMVTLKVDSKAQNFDQVKKGDHVTIDYMESVAIFVEKPDGSPAAQSESMVEFAPKGQKPAMVAVQTTQVSAKVVKINQLTRRVTLQGPEGNTFKVKVDKSVTRFKNVKKGDELVVRYTTAMALTVAKK